MTAPFTLFANCSPGIEPLLREELLALGALEPREVPGGATFSGHRSVVHRINLWSGLASHVLVRVGVFHATAFDRLVRELEDLPWEDFLIPGVAREFRVLARKSRLHHTDAIAERAARAIAKRLGDDRIDPTKGGVPVYLRFDHDRVQVSVDTSGEPLHRRGYRQHASAAPLREDLARALLRLSAWDSESPFVDPFCGSGTLPIEAALLARRIAPGIGRGFALERTALFHEPTWRQLRDEARTGARPCAPAPILGGDRDAGALDAAAHNAERAGVSSDVAWERAPVSELDLGELVERSSGALVTHPPFGRRLSRDRDLAPLYRALGRRVAELPRGWSVGLACRDSRLACEVARDLRPASSAVAGGLRIRLMVRRPTSRRSPSHR